LGFYDIIRQGIRVGNRNLAVLLTQFISWVIMGMVFLVLLTGLIIMAVGALPTLDINSINAHTIDNLITSSIALVAMAVFFAVIFLIITALVGAYVHAGNLGCFIDTARGEIKGFTASRFFSAARRSMFPMLGLLILWGFVLAAALLLFALVAGVGFGAVLMPLSEAGNKLVAFGIGVPFIVVLILAVMLVMFFFYAGWIFSSIILVGDREGVFASFGSAYRFIKGHFWESMLFTLLVFALGFAANMASNVVSMPFSMMAEKHPLAALGLIPLVLVSVLLQLYVGLIATASFVVYYVDRTRPAVVPAAPPSPVAPEGPVEEVVEADLLEPGHDEDAAGPPA